ncbi:MAG TPA: DUF177 domain-containing protein [Burkholderiales bacterium]|nr:DUF177 domain-containing protein [Burkholderiales bacterium]
MSQAGVIDGLHFARAALQKRGSLGMEQLLRLAQMRCSTQGLEYYLSGGTANNGKPCLRISVRGYTQFVCQRCLGPLQVPVEIDAELQLSESLREISEADDEVDRVLASRHMEVGQLVEDEVILALPMVPRHEECAHGPVT